MFVLTVSYGFYEDEHHAVLAVSNRVDSLQAKAQQYLANCLPSAIADALVRLAEAYGDADECYTTPPSKTARDIDTVTAEIKWEWAPVGYELWGKASASDASKDADFITVNYALIDGWAKCFTIEKVEEV